MISGERVRSVLSSLLASAPFTALASRRSGTASIFMFHRFSPEAQGHDPAAVRRFLDWLRRNRFEVLDLEELFRRLRGEGPPLRRAVVLTLDDGYSCQAEIGAPIFAEFDVPVTTFLTTGFVDGTIWMWWDQIEYVFEHTRVPRVQVTAGGQRMDHDLSTPDRRRGATHVLQMCCKNLPQVERLAAIAELTEAARVAIPETPPPQYRPMTWEQARRCEAGGMRFGPHTVTHPILARTDDAQARQEIEGSWARLGAEVSRPVPVFCYPNGLRCDFGAREVSILTRLGLIGAVTAEPGYAAAEGFGEGTAAFRVPRFCFSERHDENLRYASGLEWLWEKVRFRHPMAS